MTDEESSARGSCSVRWLCCGIRSKRSESAAHLEDFVDSLSEGGRLAASHLDRYRNIQKTAYSNRPAHTRSQARFTLDAGRDCPNRA